MLATSTARPTQLLYFYKKGLDKVATVIDGNEGYDDVLGHRLQRAEYNDAIDSDGLLSHEYASKLCRAKILNHKPFVYNVSPDDAVIGYGSTYNNKKEFDFFTGWLGDHGYKLSIKNIALVDKNKCDINVRPMLESLLFMLDITLRKRDKLKRSMVHQAINYTSAFVTAVLSLKESHAKLFIVANDHSPIPVAFAMAARLYGISDVYVQHAEVNKNFPKLDYSFSILRNKISIDVYKAIAPVEGDFIYVNRERSNISLKEMSVKINELKKSKKPPLVIYPSSVVNESGLSALVSNLKKNALLGNLKIKPHPASRNTLFFESLGVEILSSIPNYSHLSICGNSAVVIELLAKGNSVYQYFGMDDIGYDYYGFVESEISEILSLDECINAFWDKNLIPNEKVIRNNLGDYLPSIDSRRNILEREKQDYFIHKLMYGCGIEEKFDIQYWRSYTFRRNLFFFTNSFLAECRINKSSDEKWIIKELDVIFNNRDPRLNELYSLDCIMSCSSIIDLWLIIKKIEWTGYHPPEFIIDHLMEYAKNSDVEVGVKAWIESKVYDILCRHGSPHKVDRFLKECKQFSIGRSSITKQISLIKYVKSGCEDRAFLLKHLDDGKRHSELDKLKIKIQAYHPGIDDTDEEINFRKIEDVYIKLVSKSLAEEYKKYVISTYNKFGGRACFIDVKFNSCQREKLLQIIKKSLTTKQGFSLIRLGDGEGYIFQKEFGIFTSGDAANRERHWWGQQIPNHIKEELVKDTILALEACDVIGIPSVYRFLRDTNDRTKSLLNSMQGRGLASVLLGVEKIDRESIVYSDSGVNLAMFNNIDVIRDLSKLSKKVVVVSSGSEDAIKSAFADVSDALHIPIPTHYKTSLNSNYVSLSNPLPFIYKDIINQMESVVEPGDLVLIGAGVAGKVFVHAAKRCSAVGIDIGSAMDEYVGGGIHSLH